MSKISPTSPRTSFDQNREQPANSVASKVALTDEAVSPERSPALLSPDEGDGEHDVNPARQPSRFIKYPILICAFITSVSMTCTQVPLLYAFRLMTCDAFYKEHPGFDPNGPSSTLLSAMSDLSTTSYGSVVAAALRLFADMSNDGISINALADPERCSIHQIEGDTALSISLFGASRTIFGIVNLFLATSWIKKIGVKPTLLIQVFFAALRIIIQNVGLEVWGKYGIILFQCSQLTAIFGGASGYLLALNMFVVEAVGFEGRTAWLGRLTGIKLVGSAVGVLLGGVLADHFGIKAPFRLGLMLLLLTCVYIVVVLPHVSPVSKKAKNVDAETDARMKDKKREIQGFSRFLGPLACFAPRKFITPEGVVRTEIGAFFLACGVFLGILATGYIPTLLQLYSTDVFGFGTTENGWLIFMYSLLRGGFLLFVFPTLIAASRKYVEKRKRAAHPSEVRATVDESHRSSERQPLLGNQEARPDDATKPTNTNNIKMGKGRQTSPFDLTYARFSLLVDSILTLSCTFVREGWQLYLVAFFLPVSAGTSAAAKGAVLQMVGESASREERTDALAGVSLVENIARVSTVFIFGVVFAAFANVGRIDLVFTVNAAAALLGFSILMLARFPVEGSRPLDREVSPEADD